MEMPMPITIQEFLNNPERRAGLYLRAEECKLCGVMLQETVTGKRAAPEGHVCSDCYYDRIGEELDTYPIGRVAP
jgi:hypothetical protein